MSDAVILSIVAAQFAAIVALYSALLTVGQNQMDHCRHLQDIMRQTTGRIIECPSHEAVLLFK